MRHISIVLIVALCAVTTAAAQDTEIRMGDVPRTGSHFMNARSAALCGASAATGGLSAVFTNPAVAGQVEGAEGYASLRFNVKDRDYLPTGETGLEASDDGLLFPQAAAVKTSDTWSFGFAYSTPSYRNIELTGAVETDEREVEEYFGEFNGSYRTFEAVLATRIGQRGQGILGVSAGISTINETGRVVVGPDLEESWEIDGLGASYSVGFLFVPNERVTFGAGYRFGSEIDVEGTGRGLEGESGTFTTAPVVVVGATVVPFDVVTLHASVVRESWHLAEARLDPEAQIVLGNPDFDDPVLRVAFGAEYGLNDEVTLRTGYSLQTTEGIEDALVPESAIGFGGTYAFEQYYVDASYVYESFELNGESAQVTNNGIYLSVGYEF